MLQITCRDATTKYQPLRVSWHPLLLLLLLSISKWVTQKARSLHKVVPSRYTHTITTTKAILYNTHTSILTHIQLQQRNYVYLQHAYTIHYTYVHTHTELLQVQSKEITTVKCLSTKRKRLSLNFFHVPMLEKPSPLYLFTRLLNKCIKNC